MSNPTVVGLSGNFHRPSKTRALVTSVVSRISESYGLTQEVYDLIDIGDSLGSARHINELSPAASNILEKVLSAEILVVGTPTYKGSYTGLFKHFIDLIDARALQGKPVVLTAAGAGDRHALIIEHQLRPLFGFFAAHTLPTGIYATDRDFQNHEVAAAHISAQIDQVVSEVQPLLTRQSPVVASAAE
ncbi:FMN reductase [Phyllobacterium sp. YR531]|uniref:FMN reductase n=1 Tax=Phyllobacterium sp. YR531 TaxID=1144343 RepID=UPI00026F5252|nr:FMN reductase [Phyllobacterium sp. YR531]EJN04976.1 FMN reductase, MsuE subfamily [Phyllobacterium sp. YR531]